MKMYISQNIIKYLKYSYNRDYGCCPCLASEDENSP